MNPTIQYPGYTVEIPDRLLKPFKVFATVLAGAEFDHPFELFDNPHSARVVDTCLDSVLVAIGKQFAHESTLGDAFNQWRALSDFERLELVIKAAFSAEPLDLGYMLETGARTNLG
jgi:hypothetical protein